MALGRRCRDSGAKNGAESELIGVGAVRATRGLGRKRVGISKDVKEENICSEFSSPLKRQCSEKFDLESDISPLEALPQELLIRVFCGVEHADLKQLVAVSKSFLEAALVAERTYFAYSTPSKVKAFKNSVDLEDSAEEIEAPNAPKKSRKFRRRISFEANKDLAVSLFQSDEKWQRRGGLRFMEEDEC